jgi:hypothetical protein
MGPWYGVMQAVLFFLVAAAAYEVVSAFFFVFGLNECFARPVCLGATKSQHS